ncbi:NUDIX hydrolase [Rhodovulum sp. PH10]|uniref:NUDIX hydrolase n=1 Tax=Rhodovulum sp. PH10 TaxID=1187851 RepID=UPI000690D3C5|nr:NUDIX hydrolase [Rhodovulum sp. PH10]
MSGKQGPASPKRRLQYAAAPYRWRDDGTLEVLLVTTRETKRWVIPKGWPIRGAKPHASAAREALEEAGLIGRADPESIGTFHYDKRLKDGSEARCKVLVFPLEVKTQRKRWREKGQRKARWFDPFDAAQAVQEPELRQILRNLDALVPAAKPSRHT